MRGASAAAAFQMFNTLRADLGNPKPQDGILSFKKERRGERDDKERVRPRVEKRHLLLRGGRRRGLFFLIRTARHFLLVTRLRNVSVPLLTFSVIDVSLDLVERLFFFSRAKDMCTIYIYTRELVCDDERIGRACGCVCVCFFVYVYGHTERARARRFVRYCLSTFFFSFLRFFRVYSYSVTLFVSYDRRQPRSTFLSTTQRKKEMALVRLPMSAATTLRTTTSSSSSSSSLSSSSTKSKMLFCGSLGRRRRRNQTTTTKITSTSSSSTKETTREEEEEQESGGLAKTERNLGRSAMLGFAATTFLDASTDGLGPIEQLIGEEKSLVTHVVNPVNLAKDLLEVTGLYVESILLVWVFLSGVFLLAVTSGLRKPTTTTMSGLSRPNGENRVDAMAGVVKSAWREQVRENKKYELFNGRLAMLGITASFIGDYFLAEGPMEQVAQELGVPVIDQEIFALVFLSAASFLLVSTLVRVGRRALTESN